MNPFEIEKHPDEYAEWLPVDKQNKYGVTCSECGTYSRYPDRVCPLCGRRMSYGEDLV